MMSDLSQRFPDGHYWIEDPATQGPTVALWANAQGEWVWLYLEGGCAYTRVGDYDRVVVLAGPLARPQPQHFEDPLPAWSEIAAINEKGYDLTAVQQFIYDNEPAGPHDKAFREGFYKALREVAENIKISLRSSAP